MAEGVNRRKSNRTILNMRKFFFHIIFIVLFNHQALGQVGLVVDHEPWRMVEKESVQEIEFININTWRRNFGEVETGGLKIDASPTLDFDTGWFCKLDANLDLKLPYKLRFRLGEYYYTRNLEYGSEY